jgi:transcriptional regulator with XRE-family HTH domain
MGKIDQTTISKDPNYDDEYFFQLLGSFIRRMRKLAGFKSMRAFADTINISYSQYQGYETGKNLTLAIFKRIMLEFDIRVENWLNIDIFANKTADSEHIKRIKNARIEQVTQQVKLKNSSTEPIITAEIAQRYIEILIFCNTPKSRAEILRDHLNMSDDINTLKRVAGKLLDYGWLEHTDKNKNSPQQRYATTEAGKKVLRLSPAKSDNEH